MKFLILLACSILVTGCATKSFDYTLFKAHHPKSILVLPPTTASTDLKSSYSCLSTATLPIAEMGYYVFPVGVVDEFLKSNGMANPAEMHQVSLKKIDEIIHPDAVMYTHIEEYGTKFHVITSSSTVAMKSRLVDVKTTKEIWNGEITLSSSSDTSGGLGGMIANAIASQIVDSSMDQSKNICQRANILLFTQQGTGLLKGPYAKE